MPISNDGRQYPLDAQAPGIGIQDALMMPNLVPLTGPTATPTDNMTEGPNRLWYVAAIFFLIVILKIASEHEKSGMETRLLGLGVWNFIAVGLMAMLFLVVVKTLGNKYPIAGLTDVINAS